MKLTILRTWIAAAAVALAGPASAYSGLFVFGDSLSDSGNIAALIGTNPDQVITGNSYIPSAPYGSGTFSDGPTWVDGLASALGVATGPSLLGGGNYAFGGAQTRGGQSPSLLTQVGMFLNDVGGAAPSDALYVLAGGGNDARGALEAVAGGAPIGQTLLSTAVKYALDVGRMVDQLQAAGATDIIVWNAPNLALVPAIIDAGPEATFLGQTVATVMNNALARRLQGEAGVQIFDLYGLVGSLVADPAGNGLANVTDACGAIAGCDPSTYLYWDGIHPTSAGQAIIASAMITTAVPEPGTWALFAAGGLFLLMRLKRA